MKRQRFGFSKEDEWIDASLTRPSISHDGGFIQDDNDDALEQSISRKQRLPSPIPPRPSDEPLICIECDKMFPFSYLYDHFAYPVCDACKDCDEKHKLITRTDAKTEYLLKDADFDLREPHLRFISKKNPHNPRWGDMRLYLKPQLEQRALDVWGSFEKLTEEKEKREGKKDKMRQKKYYRNVASLRAEVGRGKQQSHQVTHVHDFGDEQYDDATDLYFKSCKICKHKVTYEKL